MKKIISVLLVVVTVLSMFVVTASAAAKAPTFSLKANTTSVKVGDTVKVTVSTSKNSKLCTATISLLYDSEYFKVVGKTTSGAFSMESVVEYSEKATFFAVTDDVVKDSATDLFTVEFKVLKEGGKIELTPDEIYVVDGDKDVNVTSSVKSATLTLNAACNHDCHKGGISGFFWKITNFFNRLFGKEQYCSCGAAHY